MHPLLMTEAVSYQSFSPIDRHFADFLYRTALAKQTDPNTLSADDERQLIVTFARLSQTLGQQNSCLRLDDGQLINLLQQLECVDCKTTAQLFDHTLANTPLVLFQYSPSYALLYTNRFFQYENRVARNLSRRNRWVPEPAENIKAVSSLFGPEDDPQQRAAALVASTRQLAIISGGPGTGKTSTVVKILAALLTNEPKLTIQLAAPTGKAAMRLAESIQAAQNKLIASLPIDVEIQIPSDVKTLHRLLRVRGDGRNYHFNRSNPLALDVLILDEASMIDLVMFDRVLEALPAHARLVILGDPAQLPSVDSGSVLSDITVQGECYSDEMNQLLSDPSTHPTLPDAQHTSINHLLIDAHCALKKSYRFKDDEGIGQLAQALRDDNPNALSGVLSQSAANKDQVRIVKEFNQTSVIDEMSLLYQPFLTASADRDTSANELLELFDQAQLLTPVRESELGVTELNRAFEQRHYPDSSAYYHGKPIMVMKNHYNLRLFNGDIGVCVRRGDKLEVAFRGTDNDITFYLPSRLPQHEACYAMTVHKSQGSEFEDVCLVLPATERDDFISRELVYTGITRAKRRLSIYATDSAMKLSSKPRSSGLSAMLKSDPLDTLSENPVDTLTAHSDAHSDAHSTNEYPVEETTNQGKSSKLPQDKDNQLDLF